MDQAVTGLGPNIVVSEGSVPSTTQRPSFLPPLPKRHPRSAGFPVSSWFIPHVQDRTEGLGDPRRPPKISNCQLGRRRRSHCQLHLASKSFPSTCPWCSEFYNLSGRPSIEHKLNDLKIHLFSYHLASATTLVSEIQDAVRSSLAVLQVVTASAAANSGTALTYSESSGSEESEGEEKKRDWAAKRQPSPSKPRPKADSPLPEETGEEGIESGDCAFSSYLERTLHQALIKRQKLLRIRLSQLSVGHSVVGCSSDPRGRPTATLITLTREVSTQTTKGQSGAEKRKAKKARNRQAGGESASAESTEAQT